MVLSKVTSPQIERLSPLSHRTAKSGPDGLTLQESPHLGKLILRMDQKVGNKPVTATTKGASLPSNPCTAVTSKNGHISTLWLGPDEWMFITEKDGERELKIGLDMGLTGLVHQLVNVTDYYTSIDISGHQARETLMNLTTLDMHARAFKVGDVKGSLFGHANAYLWQLNTGTGQPEAFRLIVRASMADYLWCLITRSARLFGIPEEMPISGEKLVI
ncbi:MAG: sarcosine oxidase subunit gamma family protein [Hyphomicrobiales bacterium]